MDFPAVAFAADSPRDVPTSPPDEMPAVVLGLPPNESDPVHIILTAHLRLRHFRRRQKVRGRQIVVGEMHRIVRARDALLRQSVRHLASRVARLAAAEPELSGPSQ